MSRLTFVFLSPAPPIVGVTVTEVVLQQAHSYLTFSVGTVPIGSMTRHVMDRSLLSPAMRSNVSLSRRSGRHYAVQHAALLMLFGRHLSVGRQKGLNAELITVAV